MTSPFNQLPYHKDFALNHSWAENFQSKYDQVAQVTNPELLNLIHIIAEVSSIRISYIPDMKHLHLTASITVSYNQSFEQFCDLCTMGKIHMYNIQYEKFVGDIYEDKNSIL